MSNIYQNRQSKSELFNLEYIEKMKESYKKSTQKINQFSNKNHFN